MYVLELEFNTSIATFAVHYDVAPLPHLARALVVGSLPPRQCLGWVCRGDFAPRPPSHRCYGNQVYHLGPWLMRTTTRPTSAGSVKPSMSIESCITLAASSTRIRSTAMSRRSSSPRTGCFASIASGSAARMSSTTSGPRNNVKKTRGTLNGAALLPI